MSTLTSNDICFELIINFSCYISLRLEKNVSFSTLSDEIVTFVNYYYELK